MMSLSEILSVAHSLTPALLKCRMFTAQWGRGAFKEQRKQLSARELPRFSDSHPRRCFRCLRDDARKAAGVKFHLY